MERKNLYYAQLGEAISLANNDTFEYKRISLILFDNIVENLLKSKTTSELHHLLVMKELDKCDYKNIVSNFDRFSNIVTQAKKLEIISIGEASIINFCHTSRNNLYHKLFENEKVTEYCILFYSKFLEKYFSQFIEIGITGYSDKSKKASDTIKRKENITEFKEIISRLNTYICSSSTTPQEILSEILSELIETIENFYECDANEDWSELNKIVKNQYFYDYEIKKEMNKGLDYRSLIPKFRQKWFDVNQEKLTKLKRQIETTKNQDIELSFEKFKNNNQKLEPIYIGIMLYYSEQEYLASLMED
ncbi:MAG: hypothetical protein KAT48_06860 [Bacteroidales bacterium]|nr:hypothetical protein [Bacteroidales bacterium]